MSPSRRTTPAGARALGEDDLVPLARRVCAATGRPIIGGVAVMLHGGGRTTCDIDILVDDPWATHLRLEQAGMLWDASAREHRVDGVPIHMIDVPTFGGPVGRVGTIKGVRVVGLADLVRAKLALGLSSVRRSKDLAHVVDLIERVPLDKAFAGRLPPALRRPFKDLVEQVRGPRRTTIAPHAFRRIHA